MDLRRAVPRPFDQTATGARPTALDEGMLLLRIVVGLTMAGHGLQKLPNRIKAYTEMADFLEKYLRASATAGSN